MITLLQNVNHRKVYPTAFLAREYHRTGYLSITYLNEANRAGITYVQVVNFYEMRLQTLHMVTESP